MPSRRLAFAVCLLAAAGGSLGTAATAQEPPVALVVDQLDAPPDGEVDVIVRTVASRPLAGVSLAIEAMERDGLPIQPFASLVSATAFAGGGDAVVDATFDHDLQRVEVDVASPSGTLNATFGPLVVLRFALEAGIEDDTRFDLVLDGTVHLLAPDLEPVPAFIAGRGRLRVRVPDPGPAEADLGTGGGPAFPGEPAVFGVVTGGPFPIGSGTIELLYDPAFADGAPVVTIDPRYGGATVDTVTELEPGRLLIEFTATGTDLNAGLYGLFLTVEVPTRADIEPPVEYALSLGPATALADPDGVPYAVETDADPLPFEPPGIIFLGNLEEGDPADW
jgi:hypothetical protein